MAASNLGQAKDLKQASESLSLLQGAKFQQAKKWRETLASVYDKYRSERCATLDRSAANAELSECMQVQLG